MRRSGAPFPASPPRFFLALRACALAGLFVFCFFESGFSFFSQVVKGFFFWSLRWGFVVPFRLFLFFRPPPLRMEGVDFAFCRTLLFNSLFVLCSSLPLTVPPFSQAGPDLLSGKGGAIRFQGGSPQFFFIF